MRRWLDVRSLQTRIVVLTAIPPSLLLVCFLVGTLRTASDTVHASVRRSLSDAGSVFVKLLATRQNELLTMATVTARDPRFFATFAIPHDERGPEFAPTVDGVARDFLRIVDADFIEVLDDSGRTIAHVEASDRVGRTRVLPAGEAVRRALGGTPAKDFDRDGEHVIVAGVVPVFAGERIAAVLRLGSVYDHRFVDEVKHLTGAEVSLTDATGELASTLPVTPASPGFAWSRETPLGAPLEGGAFQVSDAFTAVRGGVRFLVVRIRLRGLDANTAIDAFLARELAGELQPMVRLSARLAVCGALAILGTGLAAWLVARRIAQPLSDIVAAATALQRGDYAHPLAPRGAREVAFLGRSFLDMRRSLHTYVAHLRGVDQMKSDFIAVAAHELKTPLTVVTSFNEMIVSGAAGDVPEHIRDLLQRIQERLWDLDRLVENMLDMSRLEQGLLDLQRTRFDLRELVAAVVAKRRAALEGREIQILERRSSDPCPGDVDPDRFAQAFQQLLDNAIRFTPDGGSVTVEVARQGPDLHLAVRDTGVGIAASELEWIFDKSPAHDALHHSSGRLQFGSRGLGLGLALCKGIVVAHGGEVRVRSEPGRGSTFTIVLPAPVPAHATAELVVA